MQKTCGKKSTEVRLPVSIPELSKPGLLAHRRLLDELGAGARLQLTGLCLPPRSKVEISLGGSRKNRPTLEFTTSEKPHQKKKKNMVETAVAWYFQGNRIILWFLR